MVPAFLQAGLLSGVLDIEARGLALEVPVGEGDGFVAPVAAGVAEERLDRVLGEGAGCEVLSGLGGAGFEVCEGVAAEAHGDWFAPVQVLVLGHGHSGSVTRPRATAMHYASVTRPRVRGGFSRQQYSCRREVRQRRT